MEGAELSLRAVVTTADGSADLRRSVVGDVADADELGRRLARLLLEDGAADLMNEPPASPDPASGAPDQPSTADPIAMERAQ